MSEGSTKRKKTSRKIPCRYGVGCTHIDDEYHCEKFYHPTVPNLNIDQLRTHYICNECGAAFLALSDLQLHLKRKTAWSNESLVGCRVSCLLDHREWHEGLVLEFHKSGKHYVEFRTNGERRWLDMLRVAFYIVERNMITKNNNSNNHKKINKNIKDNKSNNSNTNGSPSNQDLKDDDENPHLARLDENWTFVEDISQHYAFAQSVLFKIYGSAVQETGHKTKGHVSLTAEDKDVVRSSRGSLLYGELLPRGVNKAFGSRRLRAETASVLFDLGMGTGKIVIQAFLQFSNLDYVYGIELSHGRFQVAANAAMSMVHLLGPDNFDVSEIPGRSITIAEKSHNSNSGDTIRVLHLEQGNLLDVDNIHIADIIMLETDVPKEYMDELCRLLKNMRDGARTLSYLELRKHWTLHSFTLRHIELNKSIGDRYPTSWSVQRGHHFYLYQQPHGSRSSWYQLSSNSHNIQQESINDSSSNLNKNDNNNQNYNNGNVRMVSPVNGQTRRMSNNSNNNDTNEMQIGEFRGFKPKASGSNQYTHDVDGNHKHSTFKWLFSCFFRNKQSHRNNFSSNSRNHQQDSYGYNHDPYYSSTNNATHTLNNRTRDSSSSSSNTSDRNDNSAPSSDEDNTPIPFSPKVYNDTPHVNGLIKGNVSLPVASNRIDSQSSSKPKQVEISNTPPTIDTSFTSYNDDENNNTSNFSPSNNSRNNSNNSNSNENNNNNNNNSSIPTFSPRRDGEMSASVDTSMNTPQYLKSNTNTNIDVPSRTFATDNNNMSMTQRTFSPRLSTN